MACPKAAAGMQECSGVAGCGSDDEASDLGGMLQLRASGHEADDFGQLPSGSFCCWWPQAHSLTSCSECTSPNNNRFYECRGCGSWCSGPGAMPRKRGECEDTGGGNGGDGRTVDSCDGPALERDNGGVNMNAGETQPDSEACKQLCAKTPKCRGYTWKTDNNQCWLKSAVERKPGHWNPGSVSGWCSGASGESVDTGGDGGDSRTPDYRGDFDGNSCDGPRRSRDNRGENMNKGDKMSNASMCKEFCVRTPYCRGYTWKTDTSACFLKKSVQSKPGIWTPTSVSGWCSGPDGEGENPYIWKNGGNCDCSWMMGGDSCQTQDRCALVCRACNPTGPCTRNCSSTSCLPRDSEGNLVKCDEDVFTGNSCDGPEWTADNGGVNMNTGETQPDAEACKQLCAKTPRCRGYTWKTDSYQCWMKTSVESKPGHFNGGSVSGWCNPTNGSSVGTGIDGGDGTLINFCDGPIWGKDHKGKDNNMNNGQATTDPLICKRLCTLTEGCAGYTWETDSEKCWLKNKVGKSMTDNADSVSGSCSKVPK
eukprot:CAMPEP_0115282364 /NCGR_PEP_ID=MMETSP0270-20121206/59803_1 /TAXON_ID=71861 /ORGANISM="Scrippsiella trochoidea, Strain CCMP3099" /LENGTH=536 /DNA_ID=CAMNT_0002699205 /DNA_START=10 /DNA_END=1620 /DNA_ORIENTATION=+